MLAIKVNVATKENMTTGRLLDRDPRLLYITDKTWLISFALK